MPAPDTHQPIDSLLHRALLVSTIDRGHPASAGELAAGLGVSPDEVGASLRRLESNHGVVLHPGTLEPWVIHPFSMTPTLFWVENARRGWWGPCIWCAMGIATLVQGPVTIRTLLGGERDPVAITLNHGRVGPAGLVAHFPIAVARAWDNVHRHCASTLVFADRHEITPWCERHGVAMGEVVPLERVAALAEVWYGGHLSPQWTKATAQEAAAKFASVGLTGEHWRLPKHAGRF
jgi:hypothetical protein